MILKWIRSDQSSAVQASRQNKRHVRHPLHYGFGFWLQGEMIVLEMIRKVAIQIEIFLVLPDRIKFLELLDYQLSDVNGDKDISN